MNSACVQEERLVDATPGRVDREDPTGENPSWMARSVIAAIGWYQAARTGRPTGCRYLPTCSDYAIQAITGHGVARGSMLTVRRLARCTPWGGHGVDPVPERRVPCSDH